MFHRHLATLSLAVLTASALPVAATAETPLERGTYLMNSIVACGNCHTPQGPEGPLPGMEFAGVAPISATPAFTANAPNITPDEATGIGSWTDDQIIAAIREGRRPDGTIIGPPMPVGLYRSMSDSDVQAIVAYLRQVAPVSNAIPASTYNIPLPPAYGPPVAEVPDVPKDDRLAWGAYLAGPLGHCVECHTPMGPQGGDFENQLGAGGMEFEGPWGVSVAANITPTGLAQYTDDQLRTIITSGVRPDGSHLLPPMPVAYYANIADDDLDALIGYLRALPAK